MRFPEERTLWEWGNKSYRNQRLPLQYFVTWFGFGCIMFSFPCFSSSVPRDSYSAQKSIGSPQMLLFSPRNGAGWRENGQRDVPHHLSLWYPKRSLSSTEKPGTREVETCPRTKSIYNAIL